MYHRGMITATEAATLIGVSVHTVMRSRRIDFEWEMARMNYLQRLVKRYKERSP